MVSAKNYGRLRVGVFGGDGTGTPHHWRKGWRKAELINYGKNGFLVNPGYSETLRQAIQTAVYDVELRKEVINNGYSTVKKFQAKNMVKETMAFYQEVLND